MRARLTSSERRLAPVLRASGLLPLAALATHQLRFWFAYGPAADKELAAQGHAYLHEVTPWIVLALSVTIGWGIGRIATRPVEQQTRGRIALWRLAVLCAVALVVTYCAQEFLEGLFADGHAPGLDGIFGSGGLWSLPAAGLVGTLVALAVRGAHALHVLVARDRGLRFAPLLRGPLTVPAPAWISVVRPAPIAVALAGRGPPAAR